jgi:K+-transporting ATPase ATPase A chain
MGLAGPFPAALLAPPGRWASGWPAYSGSLPNWMHKLEAPLYRLAGTSADTNMKWSQYALALLAFNALGVLAVYACSACRSGCR